MDTPKTTRTRLPRESKALRHARAVARRIEKQRQKRRKGRQGVRVAPKLHGRRRQEAAISYQPPSQVSRAVIRVPEQLDFTTDPQRTLEFFEELHEKLIEWPSNEVVIDHTELHGMSPEAALVLMAEIFKAHTQAPGCRKVALLPRDTAMQDLLGQVGYYKYFKRAQWTQPPLVTRHFLEHKRGTRIEGNVVGEVIELFKPVSSLDDESNYALYNALGECMNNVLEHAYPAAESDPYAYRFWWLLGYRDLAKSEISFSFYDQGEGIPKTIRTRFADQMWFFAPKGSELIERAVVEGGYSSTRKKSKGRGLPTLRRFIESAADGELMIMSRQSRVIFHTKCEPKKSDFDLQLRGTLITWNIRSLAPS